MNGTVFTFPHSVVDDVIINFQSLCSKHTYGRRKTIVESAALNV